MAFNTPEIDSMHLFEQMLLIRAYEEAIVAGSTAGIVPGTCTSVGQEAVAVGAELSLAPGVALSQSMLGRPGIVAWKSGMPASTWPRPDANAFHWPWSSRWSSLKADFRYSPLWPWQQQPSWPALAVFH